jgi:hypothetical protein
MWWRCRELHKGAKIVSATSAIVACLAWHTGLKSYAFSSSNSRDARSDIDNLASGLVAEDERLTDDELSDLAMLPIVNLVAEEAVSSRKTNMGIEDSFIHLNRRAPLQALGSGHVLLRAALERDDLRSEIVPFLVTQRPRFVGIWAE